MMLALNLGNNRAATAAGAALIRELLTPMNAPGKQEEPLRE